MAAERTQEEILRDLLEHVRDGLGLEATVEIESNEEALVGTLHGEDLGIFIGRHGQTIDAVQHLAQRILLANPETERRRIVVDAEGYRARRREALEKQADQAAIEAERFDLIPGLVYIKGFVKAFARAVGLCERWAADAIKAALADRRAAA